MNIKKKKREEVERSLTIFFPRCSKRHPRNECPLNVIGIFFVCEEKYSTGKFPSLPSLKLVYQGAEGGMEQLSFINQRSPQGPRPYHQCIHYPPFNTIYNAPF